MLIFFKNFLVGAIVSLYIIADKEIFIARSKMIIYALFPTKLANNMVRSMRFTHKTFGGFFSGKILDSAIIGVLCYIGCMLMDMPYAVLISAVIGVTNIIPFFGPYVGAIPTVLLILLVDPIKSLYLAIFILALQQFDGNILGPKILGDSTGLSSFMVIVSILIGGGLFGVPGMVVGVPICAVVYSAVWQGIRHTLENKNMPSDMSEFIEMDHVELNSHKVVKIDKESENKKTVKRANPDSIYMKIWNFTCKILMILWKYAKIYVMKGYKYCKEKYILYKQKIKEYIQKKKNSKGQSK